MNKNDRKEKMNNVGLYQILPILKMIAYIININLLSFEFSWFSSLLNSGNTVTRSTRLLHDTKNNNNL
jgi:hypothetical protein